MTSSRSYIIAREPVGPYGYRVIIETTPDDDRRTVIAVAESSAADVLDAIRAAYANGRADQAAGIKHDQDES